MNYNIKRRDLLKYFAAASAATMAGRLFAVPEAAAANNRVLVVFMRGGYDSANLLVPISSQFYYDARPNIAIPRPLPVSSIESPTLSPTPSPATNNTALSLTADWGLHPALLNTMYALYQKGQAAFIPFAGTDDLTRSHFETQDSIELGQALTGSRNYQSGFLNRLVSVLDGSHDGSHGNQDDVPSIAFTDQLPIVFRGQIQVPNMALKSINKPGVDDRQARIIASMYKDSSLAGPVTEGFGVRDEVMRTMNAEMDAASRNAMTTKGFELEARRIARLMREQFQVGFVDIGGWDTHVGEGGASGYLATHLEELGRGLNGFADEMGAAWSNTVVVVISEFGRTFRENGNRGTDHGHGTVYWVLGGGINGGRILGEQIRVEQNTLFQNRDYPVLNEYRSVFAGLFKRMYGLSPKQLDAVFAGVQPRDIGLV